MLAAVGQQNGRAIAFIPLLCASQKHLLDHCLKQDADFEEFLILSRSTVLILLGGNVPASYSGSLNIIPS